MVSDSYTEVTSRSWFGRLGGAFKAIVFGLVLLVVSFPLLFWNEGRAVERYKTLKEGGGTVISVAADRLDPGNEGRLVHVSGRAETEQRVGDPVFGVAAVAIKLEREVEMYQWSESSHSETRKKLGGGEETVTTYTYKKSWSARPVDSGHFKQADGHRNPQMPYRSETFTAGEVRLGAYVLPDFLVRQIDDTRPLPVNGAELRLPESGRAMRVEAGGLYFGTDPAKPQVGDLRITFRQVPATEVSLVARQVGHGFEPYRARAGGSIALLQTGNHSAAAMFEQARQTNTIITWLIRGGGFLLMFLGFRLVLGPLAVIADVVPAIGSLVGAGATLIAGLVAGVMSFVTVGVAWVFYRPLLGVALMAIGGAIVFVIVGKVKNAKGSAAAPAMPAMPPPPPPPPPGS